MVISNTRSLYNTVVEISWLKDCINQENSKNYVLI